MVIIAESSEIMDDGKHYYHMFANGDDAAGFIKTENDFKLAFNRFALCSSRIPTVHVLSFSIEDTHPHSLLYGTWNDCVQYKDMYEDLSKRCIVRQRGSLDGVKLACELYRIDDEQYLMNAAAYTIIQPTKDGKAVMPYDYLYGTGALYFRSGNTISPWRVDEQGNVHYAIPMGKLTVREQKKLCASKIRIPGDWLICNGFILPENYVDISGFERIYKTHNCFRVFMSSGKNRQEEVFKRMAECRGVVIEDMEARTLCSQMAFEIFGRQPSELSVNQRLSLAMSLRKKHFMTYRQVAAMVKIPEKEIRKYVP